MYAAYNVITASKRLLLAYDTGHRTTQEQVDEVSDWLVGELTRATATFERAVTTKRDATVGGFEAAPTRGRV